MDAFQGCYKNGSEFATRDCRWFSVVPFFVYFSSCVLYAAVLNPAIFPFLSVLFVLASIIAILTNPFKQERLFAMFVTFSLLRGLIFSSLTVNLCYTIILILF